VSAPGTEAMLTSVLHAVIALRQICSGYQRLPAAVQVVLPNRPCRSEYSMARLLRQGLWTLTCLLSSFLLIFLSCPLQL
jgi:hypothetical protein